MPKTDRIVTALVDPANLLAGALGNTDVVVAEATLQHQVIAIPPIDLTDGLVPISAVVTADGTIRVRLFNPTAGAVNGASQRWTFILLKED